MNSHTLYKPRKEKNGMAAKLEVSEKGCFMMIAKQIPSQSDDDAFEWRDAQTKKQKHIISLNLADIGQLLALFSGTMDTVEIYHEFPKGKEIPGKTKMVTKIGAGLYRKEDKVVSYLLTISRNQEKFGCTISFGEAEILKNLFIKAVIAMTHVAEYDGKTK